LELLAPVLNQEIPVTKPKYVIWSRWCYLELMSNEIYFTFFYFISHQRKVYSKLKLKNGRTFILRHFENIFYFVLKLGSG